MQILSYKYRLLPNKRQHSVLTSILESQRILYNAALQERIDCYRKTGRNITNYDQNISLTQIRSDDPEVYGRVSVDLSRATLIRLHRAFDNFFRRLKFGDKAGFPRFKSKDRWKSFGFSAWSGITFNKGKIHFKGFQGSLRVHMHRPLHSGKIKTCQFIKDSKGWSISFQIEVETPAKKVIETAVGIDLGLKAFVYQSDGIVIPAPNVARKAEKEIRRRHRALARCKRGSNRRKKVKTGFCLLHQKILDTRRTFLHQVSARIVNTYDLIAIEDLNIKRMVCNNSLTRSIYDVSWATFTNMLFYKAEKAGKTLVKVDPKMTSQLCSGCGVLVKKGLSERVHSCPKCGLVLDRDHNAALNILHRAVLRPDGQNVAGYHKRARGKLKHVV